MFEGGNFAWRRSKISPSKRPQQRLKAELQLKAFAGMGVDAAGIGSGELAMGLDWLETNSHHVPLVGTNLECRGMAEINKSHIVERDQLKVGFVSVLSTQSDFGDCRTSPMGDAIRTQISSHPEVDVWVAAVEVSSDELLELSASDLGVDLWIDAKRRLSLKVPRRPSKTSFLLGAGSRGKHVGVVEFRWTKNRQGFYVSGLKEQLKDNLETEQKKLAKALAKRKNIESEKALKIAQRQVDYYEKRVEDAASQLNVEGSSTHSNMMTHELIALSKDKGEMSHISDLVETYKKKIEDADTSSLSSNPMNFKFVGSSMCRGCHPAEYLHWKGTAHAKAYSTLEGLTRSKDLACYTCHVTGAFHPDGPKSPHGIGVLQDVGCESCHGPGKNHMSNPTQYNMTKSPDLSICSECHDGKMDEGRFDPATYYPKVIHARVGN